MAHHLVLGAGGIGRSTAAHLLAAGHDVTLVSRSGRGGDDPALRGSVRTLAADVADAQGLARLATGAASIVNALNPTSYSDWPRQWPPLAASVLAAAEGSGAGLVTVGNLYAYGPVTGPMTEDTPLASRGTKGRLRARMWEEALAAHDAGRLRATELRASDYFGPGAGRGVSILGDLVLRRAARGRAVLLPMGDPDALHSWTYLDDIGRLAARLATDERGWGRAWHVPTSPARSIRQVVADVAAIQGRPPVPVRVLPRTAFTAAGAVVPLVRELRETRHQFDGDFVLDATAAVRTFGVEATPWRDALAETLRGLDRAPGAAA